MPEVDLVDLNVSVIVVRVSPAQQALSRGRWVKKSVTIASYNYPRLGKGNAQNMRSPLPVPLQKRSTGGCRGAWVPYTTKWTKYVRGHRRFLLRPPSPAILPPKHHANELNLENSRTKLTFDFRCGLSQDQDALTPINRGSTQRSVTSTFNNDWGSTTNKIWGHPSLLNGYSCKAGRLTCWLLEGNMDRGFPERENHAVAQSDSLFHGIRVPWRSPTASGYHGRLYRNNRNDGRGGPFFFGVAIPRLWAMAL